MLELTQEETILTCLSTSTLAKNSFQKTIKMKIKTKNKRKQLSSQKTPRKTHFYIGSDVEAEEYQDTRFSHLKHITRYLLTG